MKFNELTDIVTHSHPVLSLTYLPRIFAASLCVHILWCLLGNIVINAPYLWLAIAGAAWPHIARVISLKSSNGKKQELIHFHIDALLCAFAFLFGPNLEFLALMVMIVGGNTIFIGHLRLMTTTLTCLFLPVAVVHFLVQPIEFIPADRTTRNFIITYSILYFFMCASMGYHLSRKLLMLNRKVKQLSIIDPLTQCYNRLYLSETLHKELHKCERLNAPLTVLYIDIDHFKSINDQYGHAAGDAILVQFVSMTQSVIRKEVDWLARIGGEEFIVVMPHSAPQNAKFCAERIRKTAEEFTFRFDETSINVTCSIGISAVNEHENTADMEELLQQADDALYRAKVNGRNRIEFAHIGNTQQSLNNNAEPSTAEHIVSR